MPGPVKSTPLCVVTEQLMKKLVFLLAAPLLSSPLWAADLMQVYREARENDAAYAAARSSMEAGQERLPQARAGLLPTLGASGNTIWNKNDLYLRNGTLPPTVNANPRFNSCLLYTSRCV